MRHDGAAHDLAYLAEDILWRNPHLAMAGGALEQVLGCLFVQYPKIERAVVQLTEGEDRCQRHSTVPSLERTVLQEGEDKRSDFVREGRVRLAAQSRDLGTLHGIHQPELRLDHARRGLIPPELDADRAVQFDEILDRQIANAGTTLNR